MSRFSAEDLDDIKARNPLSEIAGGYTKLRRAGARLVGPCPICGGRVTSQRFEVFADGESWACAVCPDGGDVIRLVQLVDGCSFLDAIERLGGRVAVDPDQAKWLFEERERKRLSREKQAATYREAERKRLFRTWKSAIAIHGTPVERYLRGRGLDVPAVCPGLRYLPSAAYWHGEIIDLRGHKSPVQIHSGPAMLGAFIRPDGKFGGLHMTWIEADMASPPAKLELTDPATGEVLNSKKMRGSKTGAHIAIALLEAPRRLIVGEGIETVLAVWTAHALAGRALDDTAFWAAGDLGNLAGRATRTISHPSLKRPNGQPQKVPDRYPDPDDSGLSIPESVEELILLGDGDSERLLTECAMERAARRYAREGRTIRIAFAPAGQDFNDVLVARSAIESATGATPSSSPARGPEGVR
jgi:hypothetical protein